MLNIRYDTLLMLLAAANQMKVVLVRHNIVCQISRKMSMKIPYGLHGTIATWQTT